MKERITRLIPAIQRELREAAIRREHQAFMQHIEFIAYYDPVTKLPNQRRFLEEVETAIQKYASQPDQLLILAIPEIGEFKEIRTTVTQADYDALVRDIAMRIDLNCPNRVSLGRIDEHTFSILFLADADRDYADIARQVLSVFDEPYQLDPFTLQIGRASCRERV